MKTVGMVRTIDDLGRIVIPKELRGVYGLERGTPMEIFVSEEGIVLKRYQPGCHLCSEVETEMVEIGEIRLCKVCAQNTLTVLQHKYGNKMVVE